MKKYTNEDIRVAAYYIWEQLGKPWGKEDECWHMALEQLMIYDTSDYSKKTKCATKKVAATVSTNKNSTKTTKSTTKATTKTSLRVASTNKNSTNKVSASNITDFSHFKSNANSLKSKVSLSTNKNIDTNYNLKNSKKSLI